MCFCLFVLSIFDFLRSQFCFCLFVSLLLGLFYFSSLSSNHYCLGDGMC